MNEIISQQEKNSSEIIEVETPSVTNLSNVDGAESVIIGLAGYPCSGTTTVSELFSVMGVPTTSMGDVVRSVAEETDTTPWKAAQNLRSKDPTEIAQRTRNAVRKGLQSRTNCVVVDGLRTLSEADYYSQLSFDRSDDSSKPDTVFVLVGVESDSFARDNRYAERQSCSLETAVNELRERDEREEGVGLEMLMECTDVTIENPHGTTYTDVCEQTEGLYNEIQRRMED